MDADKIAIDPCNPLNLPWDVVISLRDELWKMRRFRSEAYQEVFPITTHYWMAVSMAVRPCLFRPKGSGIPPQVEFVDHYDSPGLIRVRYPSGKTGFIGNAYIPGLCGCPNGTCLKTMDKCAEQLQAPANQEESSSSSSSSNGENDQSVRYTECTIDDSIQ